MCDAVSVVAGTGAALGVYGSMSSASAQAEAARAQAAMLQQQAALTEQKAAMDAENARRRYVRSEGTVRAGIGTTGLDSRNFYDILADDAMESSLERKTIVWNGAQQANMLRAQASQLENNAGNYETAGVINAASAVVKAAAPVFKTSGVQGSTLGSWSTNVTYGEGTFGLG